MMVTHTVTQNTVAQHTFAQHNITTTMKHTIMTLNDSLTKLRIMTLKRNGT
jgi:hypothetical protein